VADAPSRETRGVLPRGSYSVRWFVPYRRGTTVFVAMAYRFGLAGSCIRPVVDSWSIAATNASFDRSSLMPEPMVQPFDVAKPRLTMLTYLVGGGSTLGFAGGGGGLRGWRGGCVGGELGGLVPMLGHLRALLSRPSGVDDPRGGYLSTMDALVLALVIVAAILAAIELFTTRGRSLVCWAVEALALALLLPTLAAM